MHLTLAQDLGVKIPAPPNTDEPIVWIAIALVIVLVSILMWQLRANAIERKESLAAFREELKAEREADAGRTAGLHKRIDCVQEDVTAIRTKLNV